MAKEMKKELLDAFWAIYETEGTMQALSWLDTLKYYEEYCQDDVSNIMTKLEDMNISS
jgi:hypothetical protein